MSPDRMAEIGFQHPARNARLKTMRKIACAELLMTITLVLSIAIAATAVSFGIARADTLGAIVEGRNGMLALAAFLALFIAGMGGITAAVTREAQRDPRRD
jgi:hypothetical protein